MQFARRIFSIAGIYGILALLPQYFLEARIGRETPPAITHPEYFYGFVGVGLAWQAMFLVIAGDPVRYRLAMLPAILEKLSFVVPATVLHVQGRLPPPVVPFVGVDLVLGILFLVAFRRTPSAA